MDNRAGCFRLHDRAKKDISQIDSAKTDGDLGAFVGFHIHHLADAAAAAAAQSLPSGFCWYNLELVTTIPQANAWLVPLFAKCFLKHPSAHYRLSVRWLESSYKVTNCFRVGKIKTYHN